MDKTPEDVQAARQAIIDAGNRRIDERLSEMEINANARTHARLHERLASSRLAPGKRQRGQDELGEAAAAIEKIINADKTAD